LAESPHPGRSPRFRLFRNDDQRPIAAGKLESVDERPPVRREQCLESPQEDGDDAVAVWTAVGRDCSRDVVRNRNERRIGDDQIVPAFTVATDVKVYFCDPQSPWQWGTNENTNGLLRQYLPKETDLTLHFPGPLNSIAQRLNTRPRKTLGYKTPAAILAAALR
jgi:hypothetical protein